MVARLFPRRFITLVLALGLFLGGAAPSWAVPSMPGKATMPTGMAMMMPGMQIDCMATIGKGAPVKNVPCKSTDNGCAVCTACALPVVLLHESSPVQLLYRGERAAFPHIANRNGIAVLPALPPPIAIA